MTVAPPVPITKTHCHFCVMACHRLCLGGDCRCHCPGSHKKETN